MRSVSIPGLHRPALLVFVLLLLCAELWAGRTRSARAVISHRTAATRALPAAPSLPAEKPDEAPTLIALGGKAMPLNFELRPPSETRPSFLPPAPKSYRDAVNLDLLLPKSSIATGSTSEPWLMDKDSISTARQLFAQSFAASAPEPATHDDDLERYARHIPVVGSITQHIEQEQKAHRRIAHFFEIVQPQPQFW